MISRIIVGTLSICLFLAALVAMTPLPFILKLGKVDATGLTWSNAYGTLFDGGLDDVSFGPQRVGDVTLKMRPGALLGGRLQYSFDVSDGVGDVAGNLFVGWNKIGINETRADVDLDQLVGLKKEIRDLGGVVRVDIGEIIFANKACRSAEGQVDTDALSRVANQYGRTLSELTGSFACDGDMLSLPMQATSTQGDIVDARLRVGLSERSTAEAIVSTSDPQAALVLLSLGFSEAEGKYHFRRDRMIIVG